MREITHRQPRNDSAEVLRRVAAGETLLAANGRPAAVIGPPPADRLARLAAQRQVREAVEPPVRLASIKRGRPVLTTAEIIADVRGRW